MSTSQALPHGTIIDGRYRVLNLIGRGGFAHVYECEHTDLKRRAAVKVLEVPEHDAEEFIARFMREGQLIANLRHQNIVAIYDLGLHAETGQPYLAMEMLEGHDLEEELLKNGPLMPDRVQRLMGGVLDALELAHARGVVHKDLKPSNLFIADAGTPRERIVLLDFGIAWSFDAETRLTKIGTFAGTPAYVAPEYAQHNRVSPAIDVYQMGLIIGEALTSRPMVDADTPMGLVMAHCAGEVIMTPDLENSDFGRVLKRATALDPAHRYTEAGAFKQALSTVRAQSMPFTGHTQPQMASPPPPDLADTNVQRSPTITAPQRQPSRPMRRPDATTATPPKPAEKSILPWIGVLLVVLGAVGFAAKRVLDARSAPPPPPEVAEVAPEAPSIVAASAEDETVEESEELALTPRFVVTSRPINAVVTQGRKRLGRTPLSLRGDQLNGEEAEFTFELDGHKSKTASATVVADGRLDVELTPIKKPVQIDHMNLSREDHQRAFEALGAMGGEMGGMGVREKNGRPVKLFDPNNPRRVPRSQGFKPSQNEPTGREITLD